MKTPVWALALCLLVVAAPASGPATTAYEPAEPPELGAPPNPYRLVSVDRSVRSEALDALRTWERGSGTSLRDPIAGAPLTIHAAPFGDSRFLGVAMRSFVNGEATRCDVTVPSDRPSRLVYLVLLHELGHCLGLGHADSGVMSGSVDPAVTEPSDAEYRAVRCLMGGVGCEAFSASNRSLALLAGR